MTRRTVILALLLIGALSIAINIAVAWALAWRFGGRNIESESAEQAVRVLRIDAQSMFADGLHLTRQERIGMRIDDFVYRRVALMGSASQENARGSLARWDPTLLCEVGSLVEWWMPLPEPMPEFDAGVMGIDEYVIVSTGWPWPSMHYTIERHGVDITRARAVGGIELGKVANVHDFQPALPLRLLWFPFALNTLVYAAAIAGAALAARSLRRMIRARRNRCLRCNYDLRGAAHEQCPECGLPCARPQAVRQSLSE